MNLNEDEVQVLLNKIAQLVKENTSLRQQLISACNALMEKKL
jgi:hypothetical protein